MGRLLICLCNGGSYKGRRVIGEQTLKASQTQYYAPHPALGGTTLSGETAFLARIALTHVFSMTKAKLCLHVVAAC